MKILRIIFFTTLVIGFFGSCQKEYSVELGGNGNSSGTWEFQESTVQYKGNIDSAIIRDIGGTKILSLEGKELTGQSNFRIQLFAADSFIVGSYSALLSESKFDYFTSAKTIFKADFLTGEFTVSIISLSNNKIEGTFTGQAIDSSGNTTQITLGKFSSAIDLTNNGSGGGGTTAVGTLSAVTDSCTPVNLAGSYMQGIPLSASNTAQLEVNVSLPGSYTITTDTVNGVSFSNTGTFSGTGVQNVTLNGAGTPVDTGEQNFTVTFGASTCTFPVTFLPGLQTAIGTLSSVTGTCSPINLSGDYTQGILLSSSNTAQLEINVTSPGTYSITTDTVNGVSFSTSGTFSATGLITVTLNGTGTPVDAGEQNFTVTFGGSTCVFPVTFLPGTQTDTDYFPTTVNSNWVYDLEGDSTVDSVLVTVLAITPTFNGKVYAALSVDSIPSTGFPDTSYFRKNGGDYFAYIDPSEFLLDNSPRVEYIFLKDNVNAGTTFQSPNFTGTIMGVPATAYIKITIIEKGVSATIGSKSFNDVIKVKYEYFLSLRPGTAADTEERWFAPGVGLIFDEFTNLDVNIRRYTVF